MGSNRKINTTKARALGANPLTPTDVVSLRREKEALAYQESIWRLAIEASDQGVWEYNADGDRRFYSDAWKRIRGFDISTPIHETIEMWEKRIHPDDLAFVQQQVSRHNTGAAEKFEFEYRERHQNGHWIWILTRGRAVAWNDQGNTTRIVGTDLDVTHYKMEEFRRAAEAKNHHDAHMAALQTAHDSLEKARKEADDLAHLDHDTGLPNRRVFTRELEARLQKANATFDVILIDHDHFKHINDTYGHAAGDHVIAETGRRLARALAGKGVVARLGGDEFGVIVDLPTKGHQTYRAQFCENLTEQLHEPVIWGGVYLDVAISMGIANYPIHAKVASELLKRTDLALYESKAHHRGSFTLYNASIGAAHEKQINLEVALRRAVHAEEFEPHFQPIIDLQSGAIKTYEILARWEGPLSQPIEPEVFIPYIEQFGLVNQFTMSILRKSLIAAQALPGDCNLSLNLTASESCSLATPLRIQRLLGEFNFPADRLNVEINEQVFSKNMKAAQSVIETLRKLGVKVWLDNFGVGYSSLCNLHSIKMDGIKIDRGFTKVLNHAVESEHIMSAIIDLCNRLGLMVTVTGIEDPALLSKVKMIGKCLGQGNHIGEASAFNKKQLAPPRMAYR